MSSSLLSDNKMLDAVASLLARQHQINNNKDCDAASLSSPLLVLTNMQGKDSLMTKVKFDCSQDMVSNFEKVHALATANLLASTQRDIAKQLEEEEAANAHSERAKSKAKLSSQICEVRKVNAPKRKKQEKKTAEVESERKCRSASQLFSPLQASSSSGPSHAGVGVKPVEPKALVCSFDGCGRKFAWLNHLKYHELTHTNNRQFKCPDEACGKTFFTAQRLNVHLRIHTGEKPFKCEHRDCWKTFTTAGNLKNHQRLHTGEQPYVCDEAGCNRRFTERSSLTKHKLTHSGDKPFECKLCGKKFTQSGSRRQHMLRHHLDEEIKASLKQEMLGSGVAGGHRESQGSHDSVGVGSSTSSHYGGVGSSTSLVDDGDGCDDGEKRDGLARLEGDDGGRVDSSHAAVVEAVSCSPQVLVLSNSYPGLPTSEPVVFSHGLSDHIVTVTTQPVRDAQSLAFSHTMLNSEGFSDEALERKSDELVILSEETIYQQGDQPSDIVYAADILDHEEVAQGEYSVTHDLDYKPEMTSLGYSQGNNAEVFVHHGLSHPRETFSVGDDCRELTITEYIKPESHPYHLETDKHPCSGSIAGFHQAESHAYTHEEQSQMYCLEQDKHSCDVKTEYHLGPDKHSITEYHLEADKHSITEYHLEADKHSITEYHLEADKHSVSEYTQSGHHHVYYLDSDKPSCVDDFIGAEEVAIAQHSVETDFVCEPPNTSGIAGAGPSGVDCEEEGEECLVGEEASSGQMQHSSVEFSGEGMDPMMECDEDMS